MHLFINEAAGRFSLVFDELLNYLLSLFIIDSVTVLLKSKKICPLPDFLSFLHISHTMR